MGYAKIGPAEGEVRVKTVKGIDVTIAMFFDGTGNNKNNTDERLKQSTIYNDKADKDSSYENDYSNIARLWSNYKDDLVKKCFRNYIEGIGTEDFGSDDSIGNATGSGDTGIPAKVKKGCKQIADKLNALIPKQGIRVVNTLTIDVFGFSRGAAAARHFIHEVTKGSYKIPGIYVDPGYMMYVDDMGNDTEFTEFPTRGYLGAYCKKNQLQINRLTIRFVGLFDCVVSYHNGIFIPDRGSDTTQEYKTNDLKLGMNAISVAKRVVHFTAADEHRGNFPLTTIDFAGINGQTFSLPGVHSDIGGCYVDYMKEVQSSIWIGSESAVGAERKRIISQGWYNEKELDIRLLQYEDNGQSLCELNGHRTVRNSYSFIPLHFMCRLAIEFTKDFDKNNKIQLNQEDIESSIKKTAINNDPLLVNIKARLETQVFNGGSPLVFKYYKEIYEKYSVSKDTVWSAPCIHEMEEQKNLRSLRHLYLHWNTNYATVYGILHPMYPRLENNIRKRFIITR